MSGQDVWMWLRDSKDPKWRLRVIEDPSSGLVDIIEETTTSTADTAQTAEVVSRIVLTPDDARRFYELFGGVVARLRKPALIACGHDEDDRVPHSRQCVKCDAERRDEELEAAAFREALEHPSDEGT